MTDRPLGQRFYRHEEGSEERNQPAEELAIVLVAEGLSFVRWLAAMDRRREPASE